MCVYCFFKQCYSTDVSKTSESNSPFLAGHPKMVKLEKVLLDHFQKCEAGW